MPALIILALWGALLAPGVVRWLRNHQPTTSIASFHRQLRLLERSGPKIVEPAYRLGGTEQVVEQEAPRPPAAAPRLVLVPTGTTDKESTMRYDDGYDEVPADRYDRVAQWAEDPREDAEADYEPAPRPYRTVRAPRHAAFEEYDDIDEFDDGRVTVLTPDRARARRMRILAGLGATVALSFILGLLPGMTFLWAVTLLSVIALAGYLGLMFYASNAGLYGEDLHATSVPIARVVVPAFSEHDERYDDGWESDRIAAAR